MLHRARERPGGAEGADVQLVEDEVAQRPAAPGLVMPIEAAVVDGARGPVHPRRLPRRAGVGEAVAVQHVAVVGAVYGFGLGAIPASLAWRHGQAAAAELQLQAVGFGRPDFKSQRVSRATGNLSRTSPTATSPPSSSRPLSWSRQGPTGSCRVVSLQPPASPMTSRGASVLQAPPRMKPTRCSALAPRARSPWKAAQTK